nr:MAG: hypothetical protein [Bacteriophage sp.]
MTTTKIYRNKRNENKFIEVRNDGHYHNTVRQYMFWKNTGVKNLLGDRCLHRWKTRNLKALLEDYELVTV